MAPKKNYTPHQMGQAIEAVRKGEKVAAAARRFNVPRVTLLNKITGRTPVNCTMGPSSVLTREEENILVQWALALTARRFPISKEYLLESVKKIMMDQNRDNPFTDNKPGRTWFESFLRRNPELREKTPQNITKARDNVTEDDIIKWFKEVEEYLEEKGLKEVLKDPSRIFNADESAFFLTPKQGKVLAKRGDNNLYRAGGDEKENLSVLITANADGVLAPPMIVYNYERIPSYISAGVPDDIAIGRSESGWMCSSTFYEYMTNIFNPWLTAQGIKKPILFFLDGHKSHLTLHLANFCVENQIELIALYPNSTHILQPMDLAVFRPLKQAWKKAVSNFINETGEPLKKQHFAPVLKTAISTLTPECIKNGFRSGGLYPYGHEYIDMNKIKNRREKNIDPCQPIDPKQTQFLQYLESEIVSAFSQEKLNLFNSLYYMNRTELEDKLPSEDMALYIIWAKNKQFFLSSNRQSQPENLPDEAESADTTHCPLLDQQPQEISTSIRDCTDTTECLSEQPPQTSTTSIFNKPCNTVIKSLTSDEIVSNPAQVSPSIKPLICLTKPTTNVNDTSLAQSLLSNNNDSINILKTIEITSEDISQNQIPLTNEGDLGISDDTTLTHSVLNNDFVKGQVTPNKLNICENMSKNISNEQLPLAKEIDETQRTLSKTISRSYKNLLTASECFSSPRPISDITNTPTPAKKSIDSVLGMNIPSPFKRNLFWPENDTNKKSRLKREKIPSAVTSQAWRDYHEKKEQEKKRLQEEKEERARQREEKRIMKQKLMEEKKKKTLKQKILRRKRKHLVQEEWTSEDTDLSDVQYAESGESYAELDSDEYKDIPKQKDIETGTKQLSVKRKKQKRKSNIDSDSEDLPICELKGIKKDKKKGIHVGCFVIVNYEGEFFPGKVENVSGKSYEVSTMVLSTSNTFKWPDKTDKIWYNHEKIVEKIIEPICLNKRGYYRIPEMEKYLPDIYLNFSNTSF